MLRQQLAPHVSGKHHHAGGKGHDRRFAAGKGHEATQETGAIAAPFDDAAVAAELLRTLPLGKAPGC